MTEANLREIVKKFDPRSYTKSTPGERRELAKAGLAYEVPGTTGVFVLTDKGRAILYDHYREFWTELSRRGPHHSPEPKPKGS